VRLKNFESAFEKESTLPFVNVENTRIFYRLEGADDRSVLVMSHSLGCDHGQWDQQTRDLLPYFRILRYDMRGHGASDVPPGDYSVERLARDVLAIVDALGIRKFAFCGLWIGSRTWCSQILRREWIRPRWKPGAEWCFRAA
jgi:3-oxoadipate enol-lactonase / 4-carboxymuconolactone decarboxylase